MPRPSNRTSEAVGRVVPQHSGEVRDEVSRRAGLGREPPTPEEEEAESQIKLWLARELHDTVSSTLSTMLIQMEQLKRREGHADGPAEVRDELRAEVRDELQAFQDSTRQALGNLRRLLEELRDEPGEVTGFVDSVEGMLHRFDRRTGIRARLTFRGDWPAVLSSRPAHNLLRILEEALRNVESHSAARSVEVSLERTGELAALSIRDDGVGIDKVPEHDGFGLKGMSERAVLVGGDLHVDGSPGHGTTIRVTFPVERLQ